MFRKLQPNHHIYFPNNVDGTKARFLVSPVNEIGCIASPKKHVNSINFAELFE